SEESNESVIIRLENTAPAIESQNLDRIFEPFSRCTSEKTPGFGMGLAIARKIAENHRGAVRADFCSGRLTLTVNLPKEGR
ncbi:MAG: sensor histidine kinase, partial [Spirochaetota bacterium]